MLPLNYGLLKHWTLIVAMLFFSSVLANLPLFGIDTLHMKTGEDVSGEITDLNKNTVTIKTSIGTLKVEREKVSGISLDGLAGTNRVKNSNSEAACVQTNDQVHKLERWYLTFNLGYPFIFYHNDPLASSISAVRKESASSTISIYLELLGFYYRLTDNLIVGLPLFQAFAQRMTLNDRYVQLNFYTYAISGIYYFHKKFVGEGFFARLDIGTSIAAQQNSTVGLSSPLRSPLGFSALVGTGYALPVSSGTRMQFGLNYQFLIIDSQLLSAVQLYVGLML